MSNCNGCKFDCSTVLPFDITPLSIAINFLLHVCFTITDCIGHSVSQLTLYTYNVRQAPVFQTIFHQCVISYTCSYYVVTKNGADE